MVYICDNCGALFSRAGEQGQCPGCGNSLLRPADAGERQEYACQIAELLRERYENRPRFPNLVETEIYSVNSFLFCLPVTALQIDSGMIVEIVVEYGENTADRNDLTANIWARRKGGLTTRYLMSVHLPARPGEPLKGQADRVFAALDENQTFKRTLTRFVEEELENGSGQ